MHHSGARIHEWCVCSCNFLRLEFNDLLYKLDLSQICTNLLGLLYEHVVLLGPNDSCVKLVIKSFHFVSFSQRISSVLKIVWVFFCIQYHHEFKACTVTKLSSNLLIYFCPYNYTSHLQSATSKFTHKKT